MRAWLLSYGLSHEDIEAVIPLWSDLEHRHYPAWRAGEISFQEQRRRRIRDFLPAIGRTVQAAQLDAVFAEHLTCYEAAWTGPLSETWTGKRLWNAPDLHAAPQAVCQPHSVTAHHGSGRSGMLVSMCRAQAGNATEPARTVDTWAA